MTLPNPFKIQMSINSSYHSNDEIADLFDSYIYWMTASGTFPQYKISTYKNAAFGIRNASFDICTASPTDIGKIKGIGDSLKNTIITICQKSVFPDYEDLMKSIPDGVVEMSQINGLGPKKINNLWREYNIKSVEDLESQINNGNLEKIKGYGKKTVEKIRQNIAWMKENRNKHLFASIAHLGTEIVLYFQNLFPDHQFELVGDMVRQEDTIRSIDILCDLNAKIVEEEISLLDKLDDISAEHASLTFDDVDTQLIFAGEHDFTERALEINYTVNEKKYETSIPVFQVGEYYADITPPHEGLITQEDIHGLIHCHSHYSDGANSIAEMAQASIDRGLQYMVITDHSQSAFYANGLDADRVKKQHDEIFELNKTLAPFRIFKGIESDILSDGSLDYPQEILDEFEIVIASIHSGLGMDEKTATERLLRAIRNPYVNILGHMTGRILLRREGYPVNIEAIADACMEHNVAIETNANPRRLDVDHYFLPYLLSRGIMTSVNPDAHSIAGIDDIKWGVISARKGGLGKKENISSFALKEFLNYYDIL